MSDGFRHVDCARTIVFGPEALTASTDLLGEGYTLLTTPRAAAAAPIVVEPATAVIEVPAGHVDAVASQLRARVRGTRLVALGGGRVIDVAKALAAADPPRQVVAIPTSLSGAEMTGVHRHSRGVPADTPRVRPDVVINDPSLSASQPAEALAAGSANALAHATVGLLSDRATPIGRGVARDSVTKLMVGWSQPDPDRHALALGALLAGWAVDHSGLGPHHALAQTAARIAQLGHAHTNAALLPVTISALRARRPAAFEQLDTQLGVQLESLATRLRDRAGADSLGAITTDDELLDRAVQAALKRPELDRVAPAPDAAELRAIYRHEGNGAAATTGP
jgi:alcohol dehydrogenase class IV